eukprot:s2226_g4.t1
MAIHSNQAHELLLKIKPEKNGRDKNHSEWTNSCRATANCNRWRKDKKGDLNRGTSRKVPAKEIAFVFVWDLINSYKAMRLGSCRTQKGLFESVGTESSELANRFSLRRLEAASFSLVSIRFYPPLKISQDDVQSLHMPQMPLLLCSRHA